MTKQTNITPEAWLSSIPDGFHPMFRYPDGSEESKTPRIGELVWHNPSNSDTRDKFPHMNQMNGDLVFFVTDIEPKLPFRAHGEAWHTGWDISTKWAIDANGICWMDNAHGGAMHVVDQHELLGNFEDEHERNAVRIHLGLPQEEPSWMKMARAAGWTPPKDTANE